MNLEFKATYKYAKSTPRKARFIIDLVRGKSVSEALEILSFQHRRPSGMVEKLLKSVMANANSHIERVRNEPEKYPDVKIDLDSFDVEKLYIKEAFVDAGPVLKRWLPRAHGRATPLKKRSCHITVKLSDKV